MNNPVYDDVYPLQPLSHAARRQDTRVQLAGVVEEEASLGGSCMETVLWALSLVLCVSVNPTSCEMFIWIPRSLRPHLEIQRHVICPEHI